MSNRVCYVTAYLDIGRNKWTNGFERTNEAYMDYFEPYIELFDKDETGSVLVVYIDERHIGNDLFKRIGKNIVLIPITEKFMEENSVLWRRLERETEIMSMEKYRMIISHRIHHPEHSVPTYSIINHCKVDFIGHTIKNFDYEYYCWVDFGYFSKKSNIPSKLMDVSKLECDKINYTLLNPIEERDRDVIYTLQYAPEKIGGFFFFGGKDVMLEYQELYHNVHLWLQQNEVVDDDQHVALQCYFNRPHLFKLHHLGGWHLALPYFQLTDNNTL